VILGRDDKTRPDLLGGRRRGQRHVFILRMNPPAFDLSPFHRVEIIPPPLRAVPRHTETIDDP
jgi:hypothetical protein